MAPVSQKMKINPLIAGIKGLEDRMDTGELAFLCLNGKSENHIRDLVAFNIARNKPSWVIEREIDRIDLKLKNTVGSELNIEFKIGYAGAVLSQRQNSRVILSALKDMDKRTIKIVSCIGIMDFNCDFDVNLKNYRNPSLIKKSLNDSKALHESKIIIKEIWSDSKCRFTAVRCGVWNNIEVNILFATIQHA